MNLPSIGSYIDESWSLYKNNFLDYARITIWYAITVVIGIVSGLILPTYGNLPFVDNLNSVYTPSAIAGLAVSTINILIILPVLTLWITVGLVKYMKKVSSSGAADPSEAMSDAGRVLVPAIGITVLLTLLFVALAIVPWIPGMIFIIIGMQKGGVIGVIGVTFLVLGIVAGLISLLYYSVRYTFAFYEVIIGNATVTSSLSRSYDMTAGKFWPIAWRRLVGGLILLAVGVTLNLVTYFLGTSFIDLFLSHLVFYERLAVSLDLVLSLVVFMIMTPFSTAFGYTLYRHLANK